MNTHNARTVLVTGAAGAIGSAIVRRFLAAGDTVVATDMKSEALQQLRADTDPAVRSRLLTCVADISDEGECAKLAAFASENTKTLEVLVNCVGFFPIVSFEEMTTHQWQQVIDINLTGPFLLTKALFPPALLEAQRTRRAISRDEVPEDLVGITWFLASADADFISGQTINVDGGNTMY